MKTNLLLISTFLSLHILAQDKPSAFFRLSEDNDGINALFKGQDWGYTNGIRIDYFRQLAGNPAGFFNRFPFRTDKHSITTSGWGLVQAMYAPQKTKPAIPDKNDYAYAGGLFAVHTVHISNPVKKQTWRAEWIAGIMGPPSFARQTQIFIHRLIGDPEPNGWAYQLPTDLLLNLNLGFEKRVTGNHFIDFCAGPQVYAGTFQSGVSFSGTLRFRSSISCYDGLASEFFGNKKNQLACLLSIKPSIDFTLHHALLDGGLFNRNSPVHNKNAVSGTSLVRNKLTSQLDCTLLLSWRRLSLSFSQKMMSREYKGYENHNVGNVSLYVGWGR